MMICEIRIPNKLFGVLISIHAMVLMLVITSDWHYLYYTSDRKFIKTDLFPYNSFGHTLIYYLYQALVVSYILIGFIVLIVRQVGERDKRIKKTQYDAIFMDYMMPYMDGVETTKSIRKEASKQNNNSRLSYYRTV